MTVHKARFAFHDAQIPSLSDVEALVRMSTDATISKRRPQLVTSLRRLAKYAGVHPNGIPFTAPILRSLLQRLTPAATGLTEKSLQNDRSNLRCLLDHLNLGGLRQYQMPLLGEHWDLMNRLTDRHERAGLSRFLRFTCAQQIPLSAVDDAVSEVYRQALTDEGLIKDPQQSWRIMLRTWNRIVGRWPDLGLQRLTYPVGRRGWALPWSAFPEALIAEVEGYFLRYREAGDVFDPTAPDKPLRPRTIETQRDWVRVLASAAVNSGIPVEDLSSLDRLVHPRTVERALRWYVNDFGAPLTEYVKMLVVQAQTLGRRACGFGEAELTELGSLIGRIHNRISKPGDEKTRLERLRQFENPTAVYRMLALSDHVVRTVRGRNRPTRRDPLDIALALAHELLLVTCVRCNNLASLDLERHFIRRDDGRCLIRIPGAEVKNGETLDKELPPHVVTLLDLYLAAYRPLLGGGTVSWLFPGRKGRHKRRSTLSVQYRAFLHRWADIEATPHLIRSFADMIYCEEHPEGGEVMRRQLGHRSAKTRIGHYADPRSRAANRAYLETILELRGMALKTIGLFR